MYIMKKDDIFSIVRYLDIKNMSTDEIYNLIKCFKNKTFEFQQLKDSGQIFEQPTPKNEFIEGKDVYSIINNLDLTIFSFRELINLMDLFKIKSKQMEEELSKRS